MDTSSKKILVPSSSGVPPIRCCGTRRDPTYPDVRGKHARLIRMVNRPEAAECKPSRFIGGHASSMSVNSVK